MNTRLYLTLPVFLMACACSKKNNPGGTPPSEGAAPETSQYEPGIRIAWDHASLKRVSYPDERRRYNGYARLIELADGALLCAYEASGNTVVVKSEDEGATWSAPVNVAERTEHVNMAVPDLLLLNDGSILIAYNPRPFNIDPSRRFGIRTKKSYDSGATWTDERLLYQAGHAFENGCWEPCAIQLPSGEIQLYFANEGPYTYSNEQEISLLRSMDNGLTWTTQPETVSFRSQRRDGMPVPILLKDKPEIVVAIEDNNINTFKPYTIRNSISENWASPVSGSSPQRIYALANPVQDVVYAGAPYLRQLSSGETILSYQGTEGRTHKLEDADMKVVIGNNEAKQFGRKTVPFEIPSGKSALWNSVSVLKNNTVIALASTSGYSGTGVTEVWMIKGDVVPDAGVQNAEMEIDGNRNESAWQNAFPFLLQHKGGTRASVSIAQNNSHVFFLARVTDPAIHTSKGEPVEKDGISFFMDANGKAYVKPHTGNYSFTVTASGELLYREGNGGSWEKKDAPSGVQVATKPAEGGYTIELGVPKSLLGSMEALPVHFVLTENNGLSTAFFKEEFSSGNGNDPSTWMPVRMRE